MFLSVFEVFKIGIGPSSSHTMGPMTAALRFLDEIKSGAFPKSESANVTRITVSLHGSLAYTGIGHATDRAVTLGLCGFAPDKIDPDSMDAIIEGVQKSQLIEPDGHPSYQFNPKTDLVMDRKERLEGHANGMRFRAYDQNDQMILSRVFYSIGGGFVVTDIELQQMQNEAAHPDTQNVPHPFSSAAEMLAMAKSSGKTIAAMKRENETARMGREKLERGLSDVIDAMQQCVERGLNQEGIMPGGLNVKRRAKSIHDQLNSEWQRNNFNPMVANEWLGVYAMAVNEENASGGRVVTAPTNGAAGVIPAVLKYIEKFNDISGTKAFEEFILTASAIGGIIKHNASISGAEVGCQGEVGSASAMAAAGIAAVMGGTPEQVENAAEIALEHHLGMTCDPVGGLVQVPCIERNALGAVKAVTAASLALRGDGTHFVSLDACVETMRQTGRDMDERYKETSQGGLAVNVVAC